MTIYFKDLSGWLKLAAVAGIINGSVMVLYLLVILVLLFWTLLDFVGL